MSSSIDKNNSSSLKFLLLYGVNDELFKACFGDDKEWPCKLVSLPENCDPHLLSITLSNPDITSVVIDNTEIPHWDMIIEHYKNGGFVTYFGIIGEFALPARIGQIIGRPWKFSAYTRDTFKTTSIGDQVLGADVNITGKETYFKSNLVSAPVEDRIMTAKTMSFEEFLRDGYGFETLDNLDEDDVEEVESARNYYPKWIEEKNNQAPLVMYRADNGGKFAYLGFVNGEGIISTIVRKLLSSCN